MSTFYFSCLYYKFRFGYREHIGLYGTLFRLYFGKPQEKQCPIYQTTEPAWDPFPYFSFS